MRARLWRRALAVTLVVGAVTHVALLLAVPRLVMAEVIRVAAVRSGGVNTIDFPPRVNADNQIVVRSSPDFLYASCSYDLAAGPLEVSTPAVPGTHSVIALFSETMDNFYVAGDWQGDTLSVVVAEAGKAPGTTRTVVTSPSRKGLVLIRVFVVDDAAEGAIDAARRAAVCAPYSGQTQPSAAPR